MITRILGMNDNVKNENGMLLANGPVLDVALRTK